MISSARWDSQPLCTVSIRVMPGADVRARILGCPRDPHRVPSGIVQDTEEQSASNGARDFVSHMLATSPAQQQSRHLCSGTSSFAFPQETSSSGKAGVAILCLEGAYQWLCLATRPSPLSTHVKGPLLFDRRYSDVHHPIGLALEEAALQRAVSPSRHHLFNVCGPPRPSPRARRPRNSSMQA